jgi:hypothetical protein
VNSPTPARIAVAVLALTTACSRTNAPSTDAQPPASTAQSPGTAAGGSRELKVGLERFVGDYDFGQFTATIRLRGGTLVRQVSGQTAHVLTPIGGSGNRFKMGNTPAELQFVIDKSGEVTEVVEGVEGHTKRGKRVRKP